MGWAPRASVRARGPSLFTFLLYDNVPWNNTNAEHAVHYFAKLRRFNDGTFTEPPQLLTLVSVLQTCEYSDVNALRFLLSGEVTLTALNAQSGSRRESGKWGASRPSLLGFSPALHHQPADGD